MRGDKNRRRWTRRLIGVVLLVSCSAAPAWIALSRPADSSSDVYQKAVREMQSGNFRDAFQMLHEAIAAPDATPELVAASLPKVLTCLQRLRLESQLDAELAGAVERFPDAPGVLMAAAETLLQASHHGYVFDQQFFRGYPARGGVRGVFLPTSEQDRLQCLRWLARAMERVQSDAVHQEPTQRGRLYKQLARTILFQRDDRFAWRLQSLTDLSAQPVYTDLSIQQSAPTSWAPCDGEDGPVLYRVPADWNSAASDGERLRWAIQQTMALPEFREEMLLFWAEFVRSQFSVVTLQEFAWQPWMPVPDASPEAAQGVMSVHTLTDDETMARLACGVRRFSLPEDYNHIRLYRQVAGSKATDPARSAHRQLIQALLNRRQYHRAETELQAFLKRFGRQDNPAEARLLEDIQQPRGIFDPMPPAVVGGPARFSLLFRNARRSQLVARPVDLKRMFQDFKEYFRTWTPNRRGGFGGDPQEGPPDLQNPSNLFDDLEPSKYLLAPVHAWRVDLTPRPNHWDRRATIEHTFDQPGLYLVDAVLSAGARSEKQTARTLVWINDIVLIHTPTADGHLFQVLDAASGVPVAGATIEMFGWRLPRDPQSRISIHETARRTDDSGQAVIRMEEEMQWIAAAWSPQGGAAFLGVHPSWLAGWQEPPDLNQVKAYGVSDRPLYRPGETIHTQFWLARAAYGDERPVLLDGTRVRIVARNPRGETVFEEIRTTDRYGACQIDFSLPETAPLGRYSFSVAVERPDRPPVRRRAQGSASASNWEGVPTNLTVRVEEYRKPDFEVSIDAPPEPVRLGETIRARISARYYFGSPVAGAVAHVRVERSPSDHDWFPPHPFDWLYGPGYWWLASDFDWYPGWETWRGCRAPAPEWFPRPNPAPPELVTDMIVHLDAMGETEVEIDTAEAKRLFGDTTSQEYRITVEVQDASRRTITATGTVLAAHKAFEIYSWTDRGFYRQGDSATIHAQVRRADGQSVVASGRLDLLRITYDGAGNPTERSVYQADVATDEEGRITHRVELPTAGQFRARFRLRDAAGHEVEGGYIFVVRGTREAPQDMHFNALELTPDRSEYQPGDTVELLVATDHPGATVMLFIRPIGGVYPQPQILHLQGKTQVVSIRVEAEDQPNFFVEAFTVHAGQLHHQSRQIAVPPRSRQLNVALSTDHTEYRPGAPAEVTVRVTDASGRPVAGSLALAVYDRALDQIAADVKPIDIREFFWKWVRHHHPRIDHTAEHWTGPIEIVKSPVWRPLGVFGRSLADDMDLLEGKPPGSYHPRNRRLRQPGIGGGGVLGFVVGDVRGAVPMAAMAEGEARMRDKRAAPSGEQPAGGSDPAIRRNFADTAVWAGNLTTDAQGMATIRFDLPDNLTSWSIRGWAVGPSARVGSAAMEIVTRKELMVRLVLPRFLVERDQAVLSAVVHNESHQPKRIDVQLEIDGETNLRAHDPRALRQRIVVPPGGMQRVDWTCLAEAAGIVRVRAIAAGDDVSDAMELPLPILSHGAMRTESWAGTVRDGQPSSVIEIEVPAQRRVDQSQMVVRVSPSLALAITDALPFLVTYPHRCTEQTLNRFLPTLIVHRALSDLGVDLPSVAEHHRNLNAQALGDPANRRGRRQGDNANPVFDADQVQRLAIDGMDELARMQNSDGGWGWFPGYGSASNAHCTALVVRGLLVARRHGVAIVPSMLDRGVQWLTGYQDQSVEKLNNANTRTIPYKAQPDTTDALVFHVLVEAGVNNASMQQILFDRRDALGVYGKCLLAWAVHRLGDQQQTQMLRRNIEQFLEVDTQNETAYLRIADDRWWYWYNSEIEAMAMYLKLLSAVDPTGPTAPRLVKYLLNNRQHSTYWNSTRDTALAVEAMMAYLRNSGEAAAPMVVEVLLDGQRVKTMEFTPQNLFLADNTAELTGPVLSAGSHRLEIRRRGSGNVYWNVYASHFSLEDEIQPAGLEVSIQRRYYRLIPSDRSNEIVRDGGQVHAARSAEFQRVRVEDLAAIPSGEQVEVELLVSSRNDYEYLMLEDPRPAGFEPADTTSGYLWAYGIPAYRELRDQATMLFIERLPHGKHVVRFRLRAEAPGRYTALPARIEGMYAPELRGNSADFDTRIAEPATER